MIKANEAGWDRLLRVIIGGVMVLISWSGASWLPLLVGIIGVGLLVAGALGWCPIYAALGVSTRRQRRNAGDDPASNRRNPSVG